MRKIEKTDVYLPGKVTGLIYGLGAKVPVDQTIQREVPIDINGVYIP